MNTRGRVPWNVAERAERNLCVGPGANTEVS